MSANDANHESFTCDYCGTYIDGQDVHDLGDGKDCCGKCFDERVDSVMDLDTDSCEE